jgi:transcription antitermination factor NusG
MLNDTYQWVALYTNSRAEKSTAQNLQKAGIEVYLPLRRRLHRWSDRWKSVEEPLIRSYLFAKIRARDVVPVRHVAGVVTIVSWHGVPAVIPDKEMNAMKRLVDSENEIYVKNSSQLKRGAMVRIIEGPFVNMEGMLVSECEDGNFCISISGLDFALVTSIEGSLLTPIGDTSEKPKGIWENS